MPRIKAEKKALINIPNWSEADQLIHDLGVLDRTKKATEHEATEKINEIKADLEANVRQLQADQKHIVESLEQFALIHNKDFGDARSRKLDFGLLGWRSSTTIEVAATTLERIKEYLTKAEQDACIRKGKESIDKDALKKLTDERLMLVKARRKTKDAFFVEPLSTEAADHSNF